MAGRVEVDESQFAGAMQTVNTVRAMMGHPEARKLALRAQKMVHPDVSIPEIDAVEEGKSEIARLRDEIKTDRDARAAERESLEAEKKIQAFQASWEGGKRRLQSEQGYTKEGVEAVEKLAHERGITDLDAAAALFDRINPPPEPVSNTSFGLGALGLMGPEGTTQDYVTKLLQSKGQDSGVVNSEISAAISDFRGRAKRTI